MRSLAQLRAQSAVERASSSRSKLEAGSMSEDEKREDREFQLHMSQIAKFWNLQASLRESAGRLSNTFYTSMIILNGGALTALVTALGAETFTASASEGEASFYDWMFRLFAVSLVSTLVSVAAGRLADDASVRGLQYKKDTYPVEIELSKKQESIFDLFQFLAYGLAIIALLAFIVALIAIAIAV